MKAKRLRFIFGDQLNASHSWFKDKDDDTVYLFAELKQETNYVKHHVQKICAFFAAMAQFAEALRKAGHRVIHLSLDDTAEFKDLPALLIHHINKLGCETFEYQRPDEYRLMQQMEKFGNNANVEVNLYESEHFFLDFNELPDYFKPQTSVRMENFYRKMRKRFDVLMEEDQPIQGRWNFDAENRNSFSETDIESIPNPMTFNNDVSGILHSLEKHGIKTMGKAESNLLWPVNRKQARMLLTRFCKECLSKFGTFQDAMTANSPNKWSLYHSRLSFALNAKIISPTEVVNKVLQHYHDTKGDIDLAQVEGFVRQVLGWREYVRGMYWANMPDYASKNELKAKNGLPDWFWTGKTKMNCQHQAISQSLDFAYAHHIQRLMITGNFALIAGINPDEVDEWYLGIYIDAIEWVELPNTRGMALFGDGGWIASKPYAASGNYINKMSDYCKSCHYSVKNKTEDNACPLNSLYWDFIDRHQTRLSSNSRLSFPLKNWQKKNNQDKDVIRKHARELLSNLDSL